MEEIRGSYKEVQKKILDEYQESDESICEWFSSVTCPDLTIEENVKLYANLRYRCDGDIVCDIIDEDNIMILNSMNHCNENIVYNLDGLIEIIKKI